MVLLLSGRKIVLRIAVRVVINGHIGSAFTSNAIVMNKKKYSY